MNIGIDCIALPKHFSGAAYFILNLVTNLLKGRRNFNLHIYCKTVHAPLFKDLLQKNDKLIPCRVSNRFQQLYFYEFKLRNLLKQHKTEIFLATHYITPKSDAAYKIITIFHDMGFISHPQFYPSVKNLYFQKMIPVFLNRATHIVSVSEATRQAIKDFSPQNAIKTSTIYPGLDHFKYEIKEEEKKTSATPYILAVNSVEKRKNFPFLLEIFKLLKTKYNLPHTLVLIGVDARQHQNIIKKATPKVRQSIRYFTDIPKKELAAFYAGADLFISTSLYEGFGFTPLEAIKYGLPTFLYKHPVCPELMGDHPYVLENTEADVWATYIYSEIKNGFAHKQNPSKLRQFSWENTRLQYSELFSNISGDDLRSR